MNIYAILISCDMNINDFPETFCDLPETYLETV
jgi:hypothetical protein